MGFDHIALCAGAGKPTVLDLPNGLARGVRAASDFLMALQLTGAAKKDSIANLQIRLPVVVIGGGLTAIDTATESLAYYPLQVEKFLARYETLVAERGEAAVRRRHERGGARDRRRVHRPCPGDPRRARARPRARAAQPRHRRAGQRLGRRHHRLSPPPDRFAVLHPEPRGGGEGAGGGHPLRRRPVAGRGRGRCQRAMPSALKVAGEQNGSKVEATLPARTVLVAAGTQPNTVLAREDATHAFIDGKYFRALDEEGDPVTPERVAKPAEVRVLMYRAADGRFMSFFGDLHPSFAGNVVKAMGGAKQGYPVLSAHHGEAAGARAHAGRDPRPRPTTHGARASCASIG